MVSLKTKTQSLSSYIGLILPPLLWMIIIYQWSSVPGSGAFYEMPAVLLFERKFAHVLEFAVLTALVWRCFHAVPPHTLRRSLWVTNFVVFMYAASDEWHQLFVYGRTGKASDILIDGIGIVAASLFIYFKGHSYLSDVSFHQKKNEKKRMVPDKRIAMRVQSTVAKKRSRSATQQEQLEVISVKRNKAVRPLSQKQKKHTLKVDNASQTK